MKGSDTPTTRQARPFRHSQVSAAFSVFFFYPGSQQRCRDHTAPQMSRAGRGRRTAGPQRATRPWTEQLLPGSGTRGLRCGCSVGGRSREVDHVCNATSRCRLAHASLLLRRALARRRSRRGCVRDLRLRSARQRRAGGCSSGVARALCGGALRRRVRPATAARRRGGASCAACSGGSRSAPQTVPAARGFAVGQRAAAARRRLRLAPFALCWAVVVELRQVLVVHVRVLEAPAQSAAWARRTRRRRRRRAWYGHAAPSSHRRLPMTRAPRAGGAGARCAVPQRHMTSAGRRHVTG